MFKNRYKPTDWKEHLGIPDDGPIEPSLIEEPIYDPMDNPKDHPKPIPEVKDGGNHAGR